MGKGVLESGLKNLLAALIGPHAEYYKRGYAKADIRELYLRIIIELEVKNV